MTKEIELQNMTGEPINLEDWKTGDKAIALQVAQWLATYTDRPTAVGQTHDGVLLVYHVNEGIERPVRITGGQTIWPKGSSMDLVMDFLVGKERP